jgi:exopolysaccharide biosynthesis polyprenyl glycosylphosphotransferase
MSVAQSHNLRWERRYVGAAVGLDFAIAAFVSTAAFLLRFHLPPYQNVWYVVGAALFPLLWVLTLYLSKAYEPRYLFVGSEEYHRVMLAGVSLTAAVSFLAYATKVEVARGYVLVLLPLATISDVLARHVLRQYLHRLRDRGRCMRQVVVVGYERAVANMCRRLRRERYHGMEVVGACLPPHRPSRERIDDVQIPVLGTFDTVAEAVEIAGADMVAVLACPEMDAETLRRLAWRLEVTDTDLLVAPALLDIAGPRTTIRPVDGLPLLHVDHPLFTGWRRALKRIFDVAVAIGLLVALAPLMLAIAVAIRLGDRGPALFRQTRVGRGGQHFTMYKFRTMRPDAEERLAELLAMNEHDGVLFKIKNDPRITPMGRWLRRFSLDELPQLLNVVAGTMSLVGPRPPLPREVELYEDDVRRRFVVKPGITGLWQVSGRADLPWEESVRLDLRYVENWSLAFDLAIMWRTVRAVVKSPGAY